MEKQHDSDSEATTAEWTNQNHSFFYKYETKQFTFTTLNVSNLDTKINTTQLPK